MIQVTEKCLELSAYEGTKKVRETSDMIVGKMSAEGAAGKL